MCARAHLRPVVVYLTEGYSQPISLPAKARITNLKVWVAGLNCAVKVLISQHITRITVTARGVCVCVQKDMFICVFLSRPALLPLLCISNSWELTGEKGHRDL